MIVLSRAAVALTLLFALVTLPFLAADAQVPAVGAAEVRALTSALNRHSQALDRHSHALTRQAQACRR